MENNRKRIKHTVDTKILLTLISVAAILYGDGGIAAFLWLAYGAYKIID